MPVSTSALDGFLAGVNGVVRLLDRLRDALDVELWPEIDVCAFLAARDKLGKAAQVEVDVDVPFTDLGAAAAGLALAPALDAAIDAIDKARTIIGT